MRPKASQLHLRIAAEFANAVTMRTEESKLSQDFFPYIVRCKGPTSIFSALKVCIPDIVRLSDDSSYILKDAVSEIELNKFLARSGYTSTRHRNRVRGTKDKWTKGFQRWRFRRWLDPRNPDELRQLHICIAEINNLFPGSHSIHETELVHFMLNLQWIRDESYAGEAGILDIDYNGEANPAQHITGDN
jgi:hypothetical protein